MSTRFKGFALLAILVTATGTVPVFAQEAPLGPPVPITVKTDKASYADGEPIVISGTTKDYISGIPVTIKITNPIGNIVAISQVELGTDKTFSAQIVAGGAPWKASGTYMVDVQFGSKDRSASTTFEFSGSAGAKPSGNSIQVKNTDFSVTYSITGGKVTGIEADVESKSLRISIETTSDGVLTITLPRALIDAKVGDQDDKFFVLIDGAEEIFEETATSTDRTLTIHFSNGAGEIEIIGTQIVPEFGAIAALVLAIAIISIIAVSAKTRLRLMPKY